MDSRSILKWTALITISIFITLLLFSFVHDDSASAAIGSSRTHTAGSLQVLDDKGRPKAECPLKHTAVKAEVSGFLSRVTVTQDFENDFADKIEAVYVFPLPHGAAVDDMTMLIGDRKIKGEIMRREDAKAAYDSAKKVGKVASLLDQERPNIFTQQVANIMPGQQVRITISYVETLKYEDGSYEWSFPMVVAPRYIPAATETSSLVADKEADAARISPPEVPEGMRAGHDISLEINLDAGVPIVDLKSKTHETEVQQVGVNHALVQLKDRNTIPNKDFVLTYRVAGETIHDAVLTHRSDRGGFFTLILQPPQRVSAEDVMPKELVFVLDTSGSMSGFPLEKAKETVKLALENLYPHDTFNLIRFSGDTRVLFSEPVPASPDNLRKGLKFIEGFDGNGGTEMMKAIKAALEPSDSQQHIRIVCFMTDGHVGDDLEILEKIKKHRNARVFAMGFGDAPNRFLLDKMAEYGRGEVDYVSGTGDTSSVARRFHERVRNPLLTDISIDWGGLPVVDVYPKRVPDLFGVKPVILSGRFNAAGKGVIQLKGKMAGQDFAREIQVELPESQAEHDVLAALWARRKIDELMGEDMSNLTPDNAQDQKRKEITDLGLRFKLMTQFTSFVAIDDVVFTGTEDPRRVDVAVEPLPGSISTGLAETVTVTAASNQLIQATAGTVSQTITQRSINELPLQGRSVLPLLHLSGNSGSTSQGSRTSGQMTNLMIDGIDASRGIAAGGETPGTSAAGAAPALTASGGANGIISFDATQEARIQTSSVEAQHGQVAGPRLELITRSGTNEFHGSAFHFFGHDALDANDWFANARGLQQPPRRLNIFGGTFGGPIDRDKTFFFGSYEGMRLRQPITGITQVPSVAARQAASIGIRPFLSAFPTPTGVAGVDGFAEFASTFANPARHDVGSFRLDHNLRSPTALYARYSFADSAATQRGTNGFSLNTTNRIRTRGQTIAAAWTETATPSMVLEFRANYSRFRIDSSYLLDEFGGAEVPVLPSSFAFDLNSRNAGFMFGDRSRSVQRQLNLTGATTYISGNHDFKFGAEYRRLNPIIGVRTTEDNVFFDGVGQALSGIATRVNHLSHPGPQAPAFNYFSLYAQDDWRKTSRLTLNFGLRWDLAPPPSVEQTLAVDQVNDPANLKLAAVGGSPWNTTFANFAPRGGFAYELSGKSDHELVVRGGVGILYDTVQNRAGDLFVNSIPFISGSSAFNAPFPVGIASGGEALPLVAFDPQLKLPYTIDWNLTLQRSLGSSQMLSVAYLGSSGKRLLHTQTLFDQNPDFSFLRVVTNRGNSDYRALQLKFERPFRNGLGTFITYTWSRSLDNVIADSERKVVMASDNPGADRGPSDFDARHQFNGLISYELPSPIVRGFGNKLTRNWAIDSIFNARSARPVNVYYMFSTSLGLGYFRPNSIAGVPVYISDPLEAGGRRINPGAFGVPSDLQQGTLGRNSLRGFPHYQIDLALRRKFNFSETVSLMIQADAFNLLNHANFEDPQGNDLVLGSNIRPNLAFGRSTSLTGRSLSGGGFGSFYGSGGSRAMRVSVKLLF